MHHDLLTLARRLESAQARQNDAFTFAAGGRSLPVGGGFAHHRGPSHPLNQVLGLLDPIPDGDLEAVERFLGPPVVLELSPGADPGLWGQLARRGYRLGTFQQQWVRSLAGGPEAADGRVRPAGPGEGDLLSQLLDAGFQDQGGWRGREPLFAAPQVPGVSRGFLAWVDGEPAGGALLGWVDGVALLSGDAVLPRFRGRGLQKALIRARLQAARDLGCDLATASTLPGTPSQRAYEACGFRAAYPKVEMVKD